MNEADWMVTRALTFGPMTLVGVVAHTSMSRETIRKAMVRLKGSGTIVGVEGLYRLTDQKAAA